MTDDDCVGCGDADAEFDRTVRAGMRGITEAMSKRRWSALATPDGMRTEPVPAWAVTHTCADPQTGGTSGYPDPQGRVLWKGTLRSYVICRGCGQAFTYEAIGERDGGRDIIAISDANYTRFLKDNE